MKVVVIYPQSFFSGSQQQKLSPLGEVFYSEAREELSTEQLDELSEDAEVLAIGPGPFGGFEKAKEKVTATLGKLPNLKGLCLSTTAYGWIDLDYCKTKNIPVCNVPGYSRESVAEHTLALLLNLAKRIIVTDRKTQLGKYKLEIGFELKGKTLGIIGLGNIGSRVAELAQCIGMNVIAYNRSPKNIPGVEMKSLEEVIKESDAITLHTIDSEETKNMIDKDQLTMMKDNVIIVNTVDRSLVNEQAMAEAIKSKKIYGYAYEAEDLQNAPLAGLENVIGLKGFGWFTKEALENLAQIWVDNIESIVNDKPQNTV